MIHECNIQCHSVDPSTMDMLGLNEDKGKWLPFAFHIDVVIACKLTSEEDDEMTYNCTTIFTDHGDTYIIDTPYNKFLKLFKEHNNPAITIGSNKKAKDEDDDIIL